VRKKWQKTTVAAAVAALALAACSSGSGSANDEDTITVWTFKKEWVPGIEAAAKAYKESTGKDIDFKVQYFDEANGLYSSKVSAAARSDELPDLLTAYGNSWDYVGGKMYQQLNGKLDDQLANIPENLVTNYVKYSQSASDACKANPDCTYGDVKVGDYYFVPQISGATGYFYAYRSQLEKAGLDPDNPPATWSDLMSAMATTKKELGESGGMIMPLKIPESGWLWLLRPMLFTQLGAEDTDALFNDRSGAMWKDPRVLKVLEMYDGLSPSWINSVLQLDIVTGDDAFAAQQATWYYGGTFSLSGLVQKGVDQKDLVVFPMPVEPGGAYDQLKLVPWASGQLGISKDADNTDEALDFLKFYMSPDGAEPFQQAVHDTPAVNLPASDDADNPLLPATAATFDQGAEAYDEVRVYGPQCDGAKTLNNQAAVALTQLIGGHTTPDKLAGQLQDLFKKAWASCDG